MASRSRGYRSKHTREDQVAHRGGGAEGLRRAAARVAQRLCAGAADLALPPRGGVQAERHVEILGGRPERLVLRLVVAPILGRVLRDHGAGEAPLGGAFQLHDAVPDVVHVDHGDALEPRGVRAAEIGEPVVVGAEDRRHQRRVRHLEVEQALRRVEHLAGHPVEPHVREMLVRVVPAPVHVLEAGQRGDGLGRLEAHPGVGDEPDPGDDLVDLDHELIRAVDPFHPGGAVAERGVDPGGPEIGRLEDMRVGRKDQFRCHGYPPSGLSGSAAILAGLVEVTGVPSTITSSR